MVKDDKGGPLESPLGGDSSDFPTSSTFSSSPSDSEPCHPHPSRAVQKHGSVYIVAEHFVVPSTWSAMSELVSSVSVGVIAWAWLTRIVRHQGEAFHLLLWGSFH